MDFNKAINRLNKRANASRYYVVLLLLTVLLLVSIAFSAAINILGVGYKYLSYETPEDAFEKRITSSINQKQTVKAMSVVPEVRSKLTNGESEKDKELEVILFQYKQYLSVLKNKPKPESEPDGIFSNVISQALITLGVVVFGILLIQILVMFMRYYARLAELYDAQAMALEASEGDPELAYKFMEHFSPNSIGLGKTPETLYQKVLETIQDVAKSKSQSKEKSDTVSK